MLRTNQFLNDLEDCGVAVTSRWKVWLALRRKNWRARLVWYAVCGRAYGVVFKWRDIDNSSKVEALLIKNQFTTWQAETFSGNIERSIIEKKLAIRIG